MNHQQEADQLFAAADAAGRALYSGNRKKSLPLLRSLFSRCDYLIRQLTVDQIASDLQPMNKAKSDLARILAAKRGAK